MTGFKLTVKNSNASSSAPSKPLFGGAAATTAPVSGGLFGSTTPSSAPATGPSLFGGASTAKPATGGLFGSSTPTSSAAPSGGLFGATPAASASSSTTPAASAPASSVFGGFGAASTTPKPAATTSLFGGGGAPAALGAPATTAASTAPAPLFGAAPSQAASTSAPATGGLFSSAAAPKPTTGGLFGNTAASSAASPSPIAPSPTTNALFGHKPANPSPLGQSTSANSQPPTPLFTAASSAGPSSLFAPKPAGTAGPAVPAITINPPSTSSGGGLFGGGNTSTSTGGLFNKTPATSSSTNSGLFGNSTTLNPAPLFSSLAAAPPAQTPASQQPQQTVPGVKIDISNLKPTSRFWELHESLQQEIVKCDEFIETQKSFITQCQVFIPGHGKSLSTISPDVAFITQKFDTATSALERDASAIASVKELIATDIEDARREFTAIEHFKLPAQYQYSQGWNPGAESDADNTFASTDMVPYFERQANMLEESLKKYNAQIEEIEAHLRTVEGSAVEQTQKVMRRRAGEDQEGERIRELSGAMEVFEDAVLRVAAKVGEAREGVIVCSMGRPMGKR